MRFNPWRELRRRTWLTLEWEELEDGVGAVWEDDRIVIDPRLNPEERNAALAHELEHEARRIGWPDATAATMQREEAEVRRITAERLVPRDELVALIEARAPVALELYEVAEWFGVPEEVAEEASRRLTMDLLENEYRRSRKAS